MRSLSMASPYIDAVLNELLEDMLCNGYFGKATQFILDCEANSTNIVAENVRRLDAAVKDVYDL